MSPHLSVLPVTLLYGGVPEEKKIWLANFLKFRACYPSINPSEVFHISLCSCSFVLSLLPGCLHWLLLVITVLRHPRPGSLYPLQLPCQNLRLSEQELGREFSRARNQFALLVVLVSYRFKLFLTSLGAKLQEDCLWRRTSDLDALEVRA